MLKTINALVPLLKLHPWVAVALVFLGFISALLEGVGISLFIPFLYSLEQTTFEPGADDWLERTLSSFFEAVPPSDRLLVISACMFAAILFKNVLSYGNNVLFSWVEAALGHRLSSSVVDRLLSADLRYINRSKSGHLLNMLDETWEVSGGFSTLVGLTITLTTVLIFLTLLFLLSWPLTLLVITALGLISLVIRWMTRRVKPLSRLGIQADDTLWQRIVEIFVGMQTIRMFSREKHEAQRYRDASRRVNHINVLLESTTGLVHPISEVLVATLLIFVLFITLQDAHDLPAVLAFIFILYRLHPHIKELDETRLYLHELAPHVERVAHFMKRNDKPTVPSGTLRFEKLREGITCASVSFCYDPTDLPVLREVSFHIPRHKTTAIVGPTGAGKSTLIHLLLRLYDPTEGTFYVDDVPLQELDLDAWRSRLAIVSQDPHLFNMTVRQNIAYGSLEATEEEVIAAARLARAHDFICDMPRGYETRVGDRGIQLSGGQKQRIALARALVRDPDILILDEATNAVDSITESLIQESLEEIRKERTVLIVAHRLATIEEADQIIVLNAGRVVEQGTFEYLLQQHGLFAQMYALQRPTNHARMLM